MECFTNCVRLMLMYDGNYMCDNCEKLFIFQPERPNPEDHIVDVNDMVCDGLNTTVM